MFKIPPLPPLEEKNLPLFVTSVLPCVGTDDYDNDNNDGHNNNNNNNGVAGSSSHDTDNDVVQQQQQQQQFQFHNDIIVNRIPNNDILFIRNVIQGYIITSKLFPLLFQDNRKLRGLEYLKHVTSKDVALLPSEEELLLVGIAIRDLTYFHLQYGNNNNNNNNQNNSSGDSDVDPNNNIWVAEYREEIIENASCALGNSTSTGTGVNLEEEETGIVGLCQLPNGLSIMPWPTKSHRVVRWLATEDKDETQQQSPNIQEEENGSVPRRISSTSGLLDEELWSSELFLQSRDGLLMAFCSAQELSYNNFETIIPLETMFENLPELELFNIQDLSSSLSLAQEKDCNMEGSKNTMISFQIKLSDNDNGSGGGGGMDIVEKLTQWTTYTPPVNNDQRGGERMIFRSSALSDRLTEAIHNCSAIPLRKTDPEHVPYYAYKYLRKYYSYEYLKKVGGWDTIPHQVRMTLLGQHRGISWERVRPPQFQDENGSPLFHFVNPVFRLNKFQPNDSPFDSHYDLPYYDSINGHRSKYTLLLYLTEGEGRPTLPALKVENIKLNRLEVLQGVIFSQNLAHEGNPYLEGAKIFLRSEIVCNIPKGDEVYDPSVARLFNVACYHSLFHQELSAYATKLFNHSVACRYQPLAEPNFTYHFRRFDGRDYITNGHDYFFGIDVSLKHAAVYAIMDYFNASYHLTTFRRMLEESFVVEEDLGNDENKILAYLKSQQHSEKRNSTLDWVGLGCFEDLPPPNCPCPVLCERCEIIKCTCPTLQSANNVNRFNRMAESIRTVLQECSVAIYGSSIRVNLKDIRYNDSHIYFETTGYHNRVWFASCQCGHDSETVNNPATYSDKLARLLHIPPIQYRKIEEGGYHLIVDTFQNGWVDTKLVFPKFPDQSEEGVPVTVDGSDVDGEPWGYPVFPPSDEDDY